MPDGLDLAHHAVRLAREAGAASAEATHTIVERFTTEARARETTMLERSLVRSLTLRAFVDGAKAVGTTSDFSPEGIASFAREIARAATFVAHDPHNGLPEIASGAAGGDLEMYAADVRERDDEVKIADALELERIARASDPRIVNSSGSRVADTTLSIALANSDGFAGTYRQSQASAASNPVAEDGGAKRTGSYGAAARSYAALESIASIATTAASRATAMIGARRPRTMRCPVIFEREVAATVLGDVFSGVSAANVAVGNSFLSGRTGTRVGSDLATIVDDGRLPRGFGTSPFDAEGVPTARTVVFDRGTLRTYLYDTYYARRLGARSTGNASGGGVGPNNFYLEAGAQTPDELIASTASGVFVVDTIGFATEFVTGTYSRGARGFMIENGEIAYPIDEFTIAGNLIEMLGAIDAVANDLVFDQPIVAPTFRIAELTISGT